VYQRCVLSSPADTSNVYHVPNSVPTPGVESSGENVNCMPCPLVCGLNQVPERPSWLTLTKPGTVPVEPSSM